MSETHNWQQSGFEPSHLYQGYMTAMQFYRCRKCKEEVGLPDGLMRPEANGCTGMAVVVKVPWKSPMRTRSTDIAKQDYPAKKAKRR